jgi:hypothetical protein
MRRSQHWLLSLLSIWSPGTCLRRKPSAATSGAINAARPGRHSATTPNTASPWSAGAPRHPAEPGEVQVADDETWRTIRTFNDDTLAVVQRYEEAFAGIRRIERDGRWQCAFARDNLQDGDVQSRLRRGNDTVGCKALRSGCADVRRAAAQAALDLCAGQRYNPTS